MQGHGKQHSVIYNGVEIAKLRPKPVAGWWSQRAGKNGRADPERLLMPETSMRNGRQLPKGPELT